MKKAAKYIILVIAVILFIIFYQKLKMVANIETLRGIIEPLGIFAPLVFAAIYIVAGLLFAPLSVFSVAGGVLFGTGFGLLIVLISATIAAVLAFLIGRRFSDLIPKAKTGIIKKLQDRIDKELHENTFRAIFILRLLYVPYIALSYAAGLVRTARFWPYVLATFLTNIVGSFVFVYFGDSLDKGLRALILPAILITLTLLIPRLVKTITRKSRRS